MINGMILNQSIYNENYTNNEDFTMKLLIENMELETKLFIINEGVIGNIKNIISTIFDKFIKMLKIIKNKLLELFNKKKKQQTQSNNDNKEDEYDRKITFYKFKKDLYDNFITNTIDPIDIEKDFISKVLTQDDYDEFITRIVKECTGNLVSNIDDINANLFYEVIKDYDLNDAQKFNDAAFNDTIIRKYIKDIDKQTEKINSRKKYYEDTLGICMDEKYKDNEIFNKNLHMIIKYIKGFYTVQFNTLIDFEAAMKICINHNDKIF